MTRVQAMWARWPSEMRRLATSVVREWGSPSIPHLQAYLTLACGAAEGSFTPNEGKGSNVAVYIGSSSKYRARLNRLQHDPPLFFVLQDVRDELHLDFPPEQARFKLILQDEEWILGALSFWVPGENYGFILYIRPFFADCNSTPGALRSTLTTHSSGTLPLGSKMPESTPAA